jgi:glutamate dehydrogenase (NAD(P)+)
MIPDAMKSFLQERLPEGSMEGRLIRDGSRRYLEFGPLDVERLARLGIEVDSLGPRLVVCMWDEEFPLEIGGYLVVDNLAMGRPSMGGIRMLPGITPAAIHNLARGMTLKNAAADLPYGGGKSGIVAGRELSAADHAAVVSGFARLLHRYKDIYLPGPDVGTNDADMKTIAVEFGLDSALSKPADMGGNCIDELGGAAGGVVIALQALLEEMPRLKALPQFANMQVPENEHVTVLIQGFGAVGAHTARLIDRWLPGAKVTGVSDETGYLYCEAGLPIEVLFRLYQEKGPIARDYYQASMIASRAIPEDVKFSNHPGDLLRESAFCLVPAAPIANYLDTDASSRPTMTVDRMGRWLAIVEGANTYSPDPERKAARARMERAVYRQRGVMIATDYLVNSGGVIFAAQEKLIQTPDHLRIPEEILGDRDAIEAWLAEHSPELGALAEKRRLAAEAHRAEVIRRNIRELVDLLITDADLLPCEAAERISVRRIATRESDRTAADIMESIPTIATGRTVKEAAALLVETGCPILAVVSGAGQLAGVVTDWDVTRATALGSPDDQPLERVMTRQVVVASPEDGLLEVIRKLEVHEISAMPVISGDKVLGMVSSDLLARRSLLRLLQAQIA